MVKKQMKPSEAWKIFRPELVAVTVDVWTEEQYEEEPEFRQLAADIEAGNITKGVLDEIQHTLSADWCSGRIRTAALTVLAANGALEEFNPNDVWSRKPRTRELLGKRWVV